MNDITEKKSDSCRCSWERVFSIYLGD